MEEAPGDADAGEIGGPSGQEGSEWWTQKYAADEMGSFPSAAQRYGPLK